MSYARSTKLLTQKEEEYYRGIELIERLRGQGDTPGRPILDSSLIFQTKLKKYSIKVVECGKFKSVYFFEKDHFINDHNSDSFDSLSSLRNDNSKLYRKNVINKMLDDLDLSKEKEEKSRESPKKLEIKNVNRARIEMQRLIKSNIEDFKTFITLTFDTNKNTDININDIGDSNKKFNIWKTYVKRLKNDFKYVCVPEFQKRGAVHFHLLTNLDYNTSPLLLQERKIWNKKSGWQIGKDVKGWKYGYSMAKDMNSINIVGYMSKYMTKDIDERLFEKRKYHYSRNLKKPKEVYIDFDDKKDVLYYLKSLNDMQICYQNEYYDKFNNKVLFYEYSSLTSDKLT